MLFKLDQLALAFALVGISKAAPPSRSSAPASSCTSYTTVFTDEISTNQLTITPSPTPTEVDGSICALVNVIGFPAPIASVSVGTVTYFLNGNVFGPTPVCSSIETSETTIVTPITTTVSADLESFITELPASVDAGSAIGEFCFTATASPACPSGWDTATPGNAGFIFSTIDFNVLGVETLTFGTTPTATHVCPDTKITITPNWSEFLADTTLCATPTAEFFPDHVSYFPGTFAATATFTANEVVCTSLSTSISTVSTTHTMEGTRGSYPMSGTTLGVTAANGRSASATVCAETSIAVPSGTCPTDYTSYGTLGSTSYTVTSTVTATGLHTQSNCTVRPVAYSS